MNGEVKYAVRCIKDFLLDFRDYSLCMRLESDCLVQPLTSALLVCDSSQDQICGQVVSSLKLLFTSLKI